MAVDYNELYGYEPTYNQFGEQTGEDAVYGMIRPKTGSVIGPNRYNYLNDWIKLKKQYEDAMSAYSSKITEPQWTYKAGTARMPTIDPRTKQQTAMPVYQNGVLVGYQVANPNYVNPATLQSQVDSSYQQFSNLQNMMGGPITVMSQNEFIADYLTQTGRYPTPEELETFRAAGWWR